MSNYDSRHLIALSHFPKFGTKRIKLLKDFFQNFESAFNSSVNDLVRAGLQENIALEFTSARESINLDEILKTLDNENIKTSVLGDENYPRLLTEIYDPPSLLYYKGELKQNDEFTIAIVGARKCTTYGQQVTEQIVSDLVRSGLTIVSGLALGIDTLAHAACINHNGKTIAVLGTGVDKQSIYPATNKYLAEKIVGSGGAVISEFPIGTQPLRYNFPQRNRIISGLSLGTLVIEAGEKSGALITANCALEHNREVFAIPGNIYSPVSIGPNNLIKQGAKAISGANEIMDTLDLNQITTFIENKKIIPDNQEEAVILEHLGHIPTHINEIIRLTGLDTAHINSTLTIMEMKGIVKNLGGMEYVLAR